MYKVIQTIEDTLGHVKTRAQDKEDGNTVALIDRMLRDLAQMQPEYRELSFEDINPLAYSVDDVASEGADNEGEPEEESFIPGSYEKTATQDVTTKVENADSTEEKGSTGTVKRAKAGA